MTPSVRLFPAPDPNPAVDVPALGSGAFGLSLDRSAFGSPAALSVDRDVCLGLDVEYPNRSVFGIRTRPDRA